MSAVLGLPQGMGAGVQSTAACWGACGTRAVPPPLPTGCCPTSMCLREAFEGLGAGFHLFLLKTVGNMQGLTSEFPSPLTQKHPFFCTEVEKFPTFSSVEVLHHVSGRLSGLSNWCLPALSSRSATCPPRILHQQTHHFCIVQI